MKKLFLLLVAALAIGLCASAQTRTVTGVVLDASNDEALIGASVTAEGSNVGVATDSEGEFSLMLPTSVTKLTVSYVGYETQTVNITPGKMKIFLKPGNNTLDEVFAVAYGTAKKSEYTGSASVVKADELQDALVSSVTSALSGRVSGVQTLSSNGQPGTAPNVYIRGVGSINAGTAPLYVVDGVPYSGDISNVPATDIESMTVLKDAASAALYGARGANGVILITTKKGREGTAKVTLDARWGGNSRAIPNYDVITDQREYMEQVYKTLYSSAVAAPSFGDPRTFALNNLWSILSGDTAPYNYQTWSVPEGQQFIGPDGKWNPNATPGYLLPNGYYLLGDDWSKQLINGLRQEYNLSISGGTNKFTYYLGASYLGDEGIIDGSHFQRLSTRLGVDYQAKPWLKIGTNIGYTYVNSGYPDDQVSSGSSMNAFYNANSMAPVYPMYVRDSSGKILRNEMYNKPIYDYGDGQVGAVRNFMAMANPAGDLQYNIEDYLMDIFDGKWYALITPLEGLTINGNLGYFIDNTRVHYLSNSLYGQSANYGGQVIQQQSRSRVLNLQGLAEYQRTFADRHNVGLMIGYESLERYDENVYAQSSYLYNPRDWAVSNGINNKLGGGASGGYSTRGIFARLKYNFDEKYFFMGSYRRDASSRFAPDKRWGNFWSLSAAWEIAKEKFMEDFTNVDMLKVKFSFGQNGNDNIGNYYAYMDQYAISGENSVFNDGKMTWKGNPDITWETSNNLNVGVDFSFFKGALQGTVEYYQRQVSDMLFNIPVAASLGWPGNSYPMNVGSMRNNGVEIDVTYRPVNTRNITWDVFANLTLPHNKVLKLYPDLLNGNGDWISGAYRIYREGESMFQLYLPKYAGVNWNGYEDVNGNFVEANGAPLYWARKELLDDAGNVVVKDGMTQYGEEYLTTNYAVARTTNRTSTGNVAPKGYGGFGTTLNAYGFDLSVTFAYQFGGRVIDYGYIDFMESYARRNMGQNMHVDLRNAWTTPGVYTDVPRLYIDEQYVGERYLSDRYLISSNYLSLNNITVGYTIPDRITRKVYLHDVRVYFAGENVALWSRRKGLDPRQGFLSSYSADTYSPIRCFSGGIRLSF